MHRHTTHLLAVCLMASTFAVSVRAQTSRTFVATTGNDSNTSLNCSAGAPCRTFTAAISVTNSGGEIVVINSGGYGPATITQPVLIDAVGVDASISQPTSSQNGLVVNTLGTVTFIGLSLHGESQKGFDGIKVEEVSLLRLYNVFVESFSHAGVDLTGIGSVAIYASTFNDNNIGLALNDASQNAYVENSSFSLINTNAIDVTNGQAIVVDSSVGSSGDAFLTENGTITLFNDRAIFNGYALSVTGSGKIFFGECFFAGNTNFYFIETGGTIAGTNPGTSFVGPNQATSGTLATPIALQ